MSKSVKGRVISIVKLGEKQFRVTVIIPLHKYGRILAQYERLYLDYCPKIGQVVEGVVYV